MRAVAVRGSDFRCYERVAVELPAGLVGVVGPNGAGKTALIEMIHFGCLGYSPRTTSEGQVVRFGAELLRVETDVLVSGGPVSVEIGYRPGEPKRVTVNGAAERSVERLLEQVPGAGVHARPAAAGAGRAGAAACLLRPRAGAAVAGARGRLRPSTRAGCRSETTCCGGCAPAAPSPARWIPGTGCWPRPVSS